MDFLIWIAGCIVAVVVYALFARAFGWRQSLDEISDRETEKLQSKIGFDAWEKLQKEKLKTKTKK